MSDINRKVVTEGCQFVWVATGYDFGVPSGMTGFWDGDRDKDGHPRVTFPQGTVSVNKYTVFYEPTEAEINQAIAERREEGKGDWDS